MRQAARGIFEPWTSSISARAPQPGSSLRLLGWRWSVLWVRIELVEEGLPYQVEWGAGFARCFSPSCAVRFACSGWRSRAEERDPVSSIDRARSAAFSAPSAVASSPPSVPATPVSESAETRWDEELVAEAAPLDGAALVLALEVGGKLLPPIGGLRRSRLRRDLETRRTAGRCDCAATPRGAEVQHYSEDVRCVPRQIGYGVFDPFPD